MSSFNDIKKVNYTDNADSVVALKEYICFKDEARKKQLAIFKFQNNLNQQLTKMTFDVMQFDSDNFMIRKTTITYDDFVADRGEAFVPKMKMELDIFCDSIQIKLTYAKFERVEFVNGIMKPIPYSIKEFRDNKEKPEKPSKKEQKLLEKQKIKELKKKGKESDKRRMEVLDVTNRNKPLISAVLTTVMSLALIAFVAVTVVMYGINGKLYQSGDYMYEKRNNEEAVIHKYYGNEENILVPETIDGLKIIGIDDKAFKNKECSSLTLSSQVSIGNSAFEDCVNLSVIYGMENVVSVGDKAFRNCSNLKSIDSTELDSIGVRSFENCTSLKNVSIPNTTVEMEAFKGCANIVSLEIRDTTSTHLVDIFAGEKNKVQRLTISRENIGVGYFTNMNSLTELYFGTVPNIEFGALTDTNIAGHFINESVEILDGNIIAIKPSEDGRITLPSVISDKEQALSFLYDYKSSIHIIETEMRFELDSDDIAMFSSLTGFGILNDGKISRNALQGSGITSLYWDSTKIINDVINVPNTVRSIYVGNYSDNPIQVSNQLYNLYSYNIESLYLENVNNVRYDALSDLNGLKELKIPNYGSFSLDNLGVSKTLRNLTITNNADNKSLTCVIADYDYLSVLQMPDNITTLNAQFINCQTLSNITIPSSVTTIGDNFINNCGIHELLLDSTNIRSIGGSFVSNCENLGAINLPTSLKTIGNDFAYNCINLTNVTLSNGVTQIGSYFINRCGNVSYLSIPASVTAMTMPLIGSNCNVYTLLTPFVGEAKDKYCRFSSFDNSASSLQYLRVYNNLIVDSSFANGLSNLYTFIVDGKVTGIRTNVFSQLTNLKNIKINCDLDCRFVDLFGSKYYMNDVIIDTKSQITAGFFEGMEINALAINSFGSFVINSFDNCTIYNLFISGNGEDINTLTRRKTFYSNTLDYVVYNLFLGIGKPEIASEFDRVRTTTYTEFVGEYMPVFAAINND